MQIKQQSQTQKSLKIFFFLKEGLGFLKPLVAYGLIWLVWYTSRLGNNIHMLQYKILLEILCAYFLTYFSFVLCVEPMLFVFILYFVPCSLNILNV